MLLSYNFKQIEDKDLVIPYNDRGFSYGDGLFETIIYNKQKIRFLKDHLRRLKKGMKAFGFEGANGIKKDLIKHQILSLIHNNQLTGKVKIKIQVWRRPGGLYRPNNNHFNILISVKDEPEDFHFNALKIGFSEKVSLSYSEFSRYKTSNALPYIVASIEKEKKGYDDLVLRNNQGYIAECTSSNIFWVKNNDIFTPSIKSGCIAGIARKKIIQKLSKSSFNVKKVMFKKKKLLEADSIFLTNASGVRHVKSLENQSLKIFEKAEELFG